MIMNTQQAFDKAIVNTFEQSRKPMITNGSVYKEHGNKVCALGFMFPTSGYVIEAEVSAKPNTTGLTGVSGTFLKQLELAQDSSQVKHWGNQLRLLAKRWNLSTRVLDNIFSK